MGYSPAASGFTRRRFLAAAAAVPCVSAAQQPTFTTGVKVVSVFATVHDKSGRVVRDLNEADFELAENNRPQQIRYFSRETDLPLNLGLLVDTSLSQERIMSAERAASFRFLDRVLRETVDHIFLVQFDAGVFIRQKPTNSRKELEEALSLVDTPSKAELQAQGAGTRLYDAVVKVSNDIMSARTNRKALILLTDGVDVGSMATLAEAVDAAQRADALIYSVFFPGEYLLGGGGDGQGVLARLARETGGSLFTVSKKLPIDAVFDQIQEELRSQYSIGYVSDVPVRNPEFRRIRLTARPKGLIVQARDRYWARH